MKLVRSFGDALHLYAMIHLLVRMWNKKSCSGVSLKSQQLYLLVFITRYADFFARSIPTEIAILRLLFISVTGASVYLIMSDLFQSYQKPQDSFPYQYILIGSSVLALIFFHRGHHMPWFFEVLWSFSMFVESVAILPQIWMIHQAGGISKNQALTAHYVLALGGYRVFYLFNWILRIITGYSFDVISIVTEILQTLFYADFFLLYWKTVAQGGEFVLPMNRGGHVDALDNFSLGDMNSSLYR